MTNRECHWDRPPIRPATSNHQWIMSKTAGQRTLYCPMSSEGDAYVLVVLRLIWLARSLAGKIAEGLG